MSGTYGSAQPDANPELGAHFRLEVDNIAVAAFEECTLGASEWNTMDERTGIDGDTSQPVSGTKKPETCSCVKHLRVGGVEDILQLLNWHRKGSKDRRRGAIVHLDRDGNEIMRWNFTGGWISKRGEIPLKAAGGADPIPFPFDITAPEFVPSK